MSHGKVAERYAQAIFELGVETGQLGPLAEKLALFAAAYSSSRELRQVLVNPTVTVAERRAVIEALARRLMVPEPGVKALLVLTQRRRIDAISGIVARLTELSDRQENVVRATVTTAAKMPESYYSNLVAKLASATQKKVVLERKEDASLIGGAIARVGDTVVDGSVRGQLAELERRLLSAVSA